MKEARLIVALFALAFAIYATFVGGMLLVSGRSGNAGTGEDIASGVLVLTIAAGLYFVVGVLLLGRVSSGEPSRLNRVRDDVSDWRDKLSALLHLQ